ncbi:MAG: hypothetical protein KIH67_004000 [Candidatus Moranbacteria bacterium]|nr:hypothetical protein [Candidatus Moranbacteria bacterium]
MPLQNAATAQKILLGAFIIGFGSIILGFTSKLHFPDSDYNFLGKKDRARLSIDKPLSQVFVAQENGLSEVKVHIGGLDLWPGEALVFELRDESCAHTLATDSWTPLKPKPLNYTRFTFERIPESMEKKYCAYITYTSPYDRKTNDAPYINTNELAGKSYTAVSKNKVYENETLQLRPAYSTDSFAADTWRLIERMSQYKPTYIKGLPLLLLFGFTILGGFSLGLWIIFEKEEDRRR